MILQQVRDEMNRVNWVLDRAESVRGRFGSKARKTELLQQAILASVRGIEALQEDVQTRLPLPPVSEIDRQVLETIRQDDALVRQFVKAECRLLEDMGVDAKAASRIHSELEHSLRRILVDNTLRSRETVEAQLADLVVDLRRELGGLKGDADHRELIRKLEGVVIALAGGMVVTSNALIGAGLIPVTGGLSAVGVALSGAAGQDLVTRGIDRTVG